MALPAFVGLLSAAAPYIGSLLGLDGGDPSVAPPKPSPFMQSLNAGATADQSPAAQQSRDQMFRTMPPAIPSGSLDPSQVNWVNPDTGISASQKNLNTPPPVPSYEDFLKQYHQQALWSAIGKGPGQALGAIFGGVDAGAPAAYADLQKSAQGAEQGRLGLAMPTIVNEILSGKRDPNSGALLAPPQGSAPPAAMPPQPDTGAPQGMPAAPAMPAPQGIPGQPGPLLAPPGASAAFPPAAVAPPPQGASQAPPQGGGVLSTPPGLTPIQAIIMRATDPVRYKSIVDGQSASIRAGSYGPADSSGNRQMYPAGMPGNPYQPNDPRFAQYQTQLEGQLSTARAGGPAHFEPQPFVGPDGKQYATSRFNAFGGGPGGVSGGSTSTAAPRPGGSGPLQTGLSPLQSSSAEARGKQLEEYGATLESGATNAHNQQFLIDQMRNESGNGAGWTPGHFAEWVGAARSMLNGAGLSGPETDNALANFQAFQKNSMQLTTAATRAVSPRAAVQEMQMIREALPGAHTSQGGLSYMFDQFSANNDFQQAKAQAAQAYRTRPGGDGTLSGFESQWNSNVSPYAFLVHRMGAPELATMAGNLQKSPQGRALLGKITGEVKFAQGNGLFQDGGQ